MINARSIWRFLTRQRVLHYNYYQVRIIDLLWHTNKVLIFINFLARKANLATIRVTNAHELAYDVNRRRVLMYL